MKRVSAVGFETPNQLIRAEYIFPTPVEGQSDQLLEVYRTWREPEVKIHERVANENVLAIIVDSETEKIRLEGLAERHNSNIPIYTRSELYGDNGLFSNEPFENFRARLVEIAQQGRVVQNPQTASNIPSRISNWVEENVTSRFTRTSPSSGSPQSLPERQLAEQYRRNYKVINMVEESGLADGSGRLTNRIAFSEMIPEGADPNTLTVSLSGFGQQRPDEVSPLSMQLAQTLNSRTIDVSVLDIPQSYAPGNIEVDQRLILEALRDNGVIFPEKVVIVGYSEAAPLSHVVGEEISKLTTGEVISVSVTGYGITDIAATPAEFVRNFALEVAHIGLTSSPLESINSLTNLFRVLRRVEFPRLLAEIARGDFSSIRIEQIRKIYQATPGILEPSANHSEIFLIPERDITSPLSVLRPFLIQDNIPGITRRIMPGDNHQSPITNASEYARVIRDLIDNPRSESVLAP